MAKIVQFGVLPAFLKGIYQGDVSFKEIQCYGDTGLGTVNNLQGELIAIDGHFYQFDEKMKGSLVESENATPFAVVSEFKPTQSFQLSNISSLHELNKLLEDKFTSKNLFYLLRVDGVFTNLRIRSEKCNFLNHQPLDELLPKIQKKYLIKEIKGSLIATYFPNCCSQITIPEFHYHFIDADRKKGGHVFDTAIKTAHVTMQQCDELCLKLFNTPEYYEANLDVNSLDALKKIE